MRKNQKGFSAIESLFIFTIMAIVVGVGWYVHSQQSKVSKPKPTTHLNSQTSHNPTGNVQYKDSASGLSFSYPSRWGTVVKHKIGDPDRLVPDPNDKTTQYDYTLTGAPLFILPVANGNDNYMEEYAGCFTNLVLLNLRQGNSVAPKAGGWVQSATSTDSSGTYRKVVIGNQQTTMIMDFEFSTVVNSQDYCTGLSVYGSQGVNNNSQGLQKIDFLWSQTATSFGKNQPTGGLKDLADFKQNQSKYISDQDLNDLQATIKSMHTY